MLDSRKHPQISKSNSHLPIVIVSGYFYVDDQTIEGALQSGLISAFIGEPFVHEEIMRVIRLYAPR